MKTVIDERSIRARLAVLRAEKVIEENPAANFAAELNRAMREVDPNIVLTDPAEARRTELARQWWAEKQRIAASEAAAPKTLNELSDALLAAKPGSPERRQLEEQWANATKTARPTSRIEFTEADVQRARERRTR